MNPGVIAPSGALGYPFARGPSIRYRGGQGDAEPCKSPELRSIGRIRVEMGDDYRAHAYRPGLGRRLTLWQTGSKARAGRKRISQVDSDWDLW